MIDTNKEQLARELIKTLEKEKGVPVRLRIDIPDKYNVEIFGAFNKRPIEVKRVSKLNPKYEQEVAILEGHYKSLKELQKKIMEYDALYGVYGWEGTLAERAYKLVRDSFPQESILSSYKYSTTFATVDGLMFVMPLAGNFHVPDSKGFEERTYKVLNENNIKYFQHRIVATPNGVYDYRHVGHMSPIDRAKIADIKLTLIK